MSKPVGKNEGVRLPLRILFLLYLEKFVEIVLVFLLTLVSVKWDPLLNVMQHLFWVLTLFVVMSMVALPIAYRLPWFRQCPGFLLYKFLYLMFMTAVFLLLAVHIPESMTFLSPFFALVAAATVAVYYIFFAFVTVTHKHLCRVPARGCSLWLVLIAIPIAVILINQPVYFSDGIWQFNGYWDFLANVAAGIIASLPFSYEALYIYRKFVKAKTLEEFLGSTMLLPGFVTMYYSKDLVKAEPDEKIDVAVNTMECMEQINLENESLDA